MIAPGFIVQFPEGKPLKITLPVAREQVGCVITPTTGAPGVAGCTIITTLADAGDVHPTELVTVKVRVPDSKPEMVVVDPEPDIDPGFIVQLPAGSPLNSTLPVETVQVGCVIAPTMGADGVTGCALIITLADTDDIHPAELVTV